MKTVETTLLELVRDGCPWCGQKEVFYLHGWESFTTEITYDNEHNEIGWGETDHHDMKDLWVSCPDCEFEGDAKKRGSNEAEFPVVYDKAG